MRSSPDLCDSDPETCPREILYKPTRADRVPEQWENLTPTTFLVANRQEGHDTLLVVPGFGVSVKRMPIDQVLWQQPGRYRSIVTTHAINYQTTHEFLLWQYEQILAELARGEIDVVGISIGGSTALQLLAHLHKTNRRLYSRFRMLVTLATPVLGTDLTFQWQRTVLPLCKKIAHINRNPQQKSLSDLMFRQALRVFHAARRDSIEERGLEIASVTEAGFVCAYAGETYLSAPQALSLSSLEGISIHALALSKDPIVENAHAERYAADSSKTSYTVIKGLHQGNFYSSSQSAIDIFLTRHLS